MGPDGGRPRPIDENLREGQDFVLTHSGDIVLAPRRLRWTVDEVLLSVNRMEEELGENLVGNRIGEEINYSGFFFFFLMTICIFLCIYGFDFLEVSMLIVLEFFVLRLILSGLVNWVCLDLEKNMKIEVHVLGWRFLGLTFF